MTVQSHINRPLGEHASTLFLSVPHAVELVRRKDLVTCLRGIADAIRHAIPAGSHAGRLGGDEFAVAVPLPLSETHVLAEHIRNRVQALNHDIPGVRCSVSIGLAEPSSPDIDLRGWMEDADRALYRAKAAGRNLAHAAEQPVEFVEP